MFLAGAGTVAGPATSVALRGPPGRLAAPNRLAFGGWCVLSLSAAEQRAQVEGVGFAFVQIVPVPMTSFLLAQSAGA